MAGALPSQRSDPAARLRMVHPARILMGPLATARALRCDMSSHHFSVLRFDSEQASSKALVAQIYMHAL